MKSSNPSVGCLVLVVLAIGLTYASVWLVRVEECPVQSSYDCRPQAGFPLPIIRDHVGSSPTGGWGRLDSSDWPDPFGIVLDVLFYGALIELIWTTAQVARRKEKPWALLPMVPLLLWVLLLLLGPPYVEAATRREMEHRASTLASIAGDWHGTDQATGAEFTLRFQEPYTVLIVRPEFPFGNMGDYSWQGDDTISFLFRWGSPFPDDGAGPCTYVPSFLKRDCHYTVVEPASDRGYPASPSTTNPAPASGSYPAPQSGPYPAPPSEPPVYVRGLRSELNAYFEIKLDGDTMTLTHESGTVQTLRR